MIARLCMLAALAAPAFAQASIEGVVIDEVTREPVRKADVYLNGAAPARALSDATGRFAFRRLPAGTFYVSASRSGFDYANAQFELAADEKKTGLELALLPHSAVGGRIVDEFGMPVAGCGVSAMKAQNRQGSRRAFPSGGNSTDDRGEYRIEDLPAGRYYIWAKCASAVTAPHPFMRRADPDIPVRAYVPLFYPGAAGPDEATKVAIAPGADVRGIDIRVRLADAVTVRGHVTGDAEHVGVSLFPRLSGSVMPFEPGVTVDRATGNFRLRPVLPGSYLLVANSMGEGPLQAVEPLEIGNTAPDPIELTLSPGAEVSGTLEIEGGADIPANAQISLTPVDVHGNWRAYQVAVAKDGTFTFHGIFPGRWTLAVTNVPGSLKQFAIGDRNLQRTFDFTASTEPWRVVMTTKTGRLSGALSSALPAGRMALAFIFRDEPESALERTMTITREGRFESDLPPGRYRIAAVETANTVELDRLPAARTQPVEITADAPAKITVDLIQAGELKRILQEAE